MADAERNVVVKFSIQTDGSSAESAKTMANSIKEAHESSTAAATGSIQRQRAAADEAFRAAEQMQRTTVASTRRSTDSIGRMYKDSTEEVGSRMTILESDVKGVENAIKEWERTSQESERTVTRATNQMRIGYNRLLTGVEQVARGVVLLGLVSERDLENALRTFAKFQAAVDLTKGIINVISGLSRTYGALSASIDVATASQVRFTAASTAGAGASVAGTAGSTGARAFGVAALSAVGVAATGVAAGLAAIVAVSPGMREAILDLTGSLSSAAREAEKRKEEARKRQEDLELEQLAGDRSQRFERRQADLRQARFASNDFDRFVDENTGGGSVERQLSNALAGLRDVRIAFARRRRENEESPDPNFAGQRAIFAQQEKSFLEEIMALKVRGFEIDKRGVEERIRGTQDMINLLTRERDQLQRQADQNRRQQQDAIQRFAEASPQDIQRLKNIKAKLDRGDDLSSEQIRFARSSGLFNQQAQEQAERLAKKRGVDAFLTDELAAAASLDRQIQAKTVEIKTQNDIKISLEDSVEEMVRELREELRPMGEQLTKTVIQALRDGVTQDNRNRAVNRQVQQEVAAQQ